MWKPEQKAPSPTEVPGLGTATLSLASKSSQTPNSSPLTKESSSSNSSAQRSIDLPLQTPPTLQLRPFMPPHDIQMQEPNMECAPMSISPHEIMHAATSNTFEVLSHETGRPCSRAQSFDDFMRLHRLQDRRATAPVLSAPLATTELPQFPEQHINGAVNPSYGAWEPNPYFNAFIPSHDLSHTLREGITTNAMDGIAHFGLNNRGEYDADAYSDLSWQHFMNGLEL